MAFVKYESPFHVNLSKEEADEKVKKTDLVIEIIKLLNEIASTDEIHDILACNIDELSESRLKVIKNTLKNFDKFKL